jgi:hypothetical protein
MFRAVDLHQFAQAVPPSARLVWGGEPMAPVDPQPVGDHPPAQRLTRDRTPVQLRQFLRSEWRTKVRPGKGQDRLKADALR